MAKLRKCPVCGCEAAIMCKYTILGLLYMPYCTNIRCNLKGLNFRTRKEAERSWNSDDLMERMVYDGK